MFNSLEGDGIIENIYHFLWTKDLTLILNIQFIFLKQLYINIESLYFGILQVL